MRTISERIRSACSRLLRHFAAALLVSTGSANAEAEARYGYIRLINAVAQGDGPVQLLVDGEDLNPGGYFLGDITGGIGLKPGVHRIAVRRDGVETGETNVRVGTDDTTTLIPFAEKVPASDDKPAHWAIRILRLKQKETEAGRSATFVSVCQEPEIKVELGAGGEWTAAHVKRLSTAQLPVRESHGYVPIRVNGTELPAMEVAAPGTYVVLLYQDAAGKVLTLNYRDIRFLSAD